MMFGKDLIISTGRALSWRQVTGGKRVRTPDLSLRGVRKMAAVRALRERLDPRDNAVAERM